MWREYCAVLSDVSKESSAVIFRVKLCLQFDIPTDTNLSRTAEIIKKAQHLTSQQDVFT